LSSQLSARKKAANPNNGNNLNRQKSRAGGDDNDDYGKDNDDYNNDNGMGCMAVNLHETDYRHGDVW
jgi:hypothetical protein